MSNAKKPSAGDDARLFREAMKKVRPLRLDENRFTPPRNPPSPLPRQKEADEQRVLDEMMTAPVDFAEVERGDELLFLREGIQHTVLRKLRRGRFSRRLELDLHGMTVPEAQRAIADFLRLCQAERISCARAETGAEKPGQPLAPPARRGVGILLRPTGRWRHRCALRPHKDQRLSVPGSRIAQRGNIRVQRRGTTSPNRRHTCCIPSRRCSLINPMEMPSPLPLPAAQLATTAQAA